MKKNIIHASLSFFILCGINYYFFPMADKLVPDYGVNVSGTNSIFNIVLFLAIWYGIKKAPKIARRAKAFIFSIAGFLAISQSIGNILVKKNNLTLWGLEHLTFAFMLIGLFFLFNYILVYLFHWLDNYKQKEKKEKIWWFFTDNAKSFWLVFLAFAICYLPYIITYWKGIGGHDLRISIIPQIESGNYSAHHPLIYTLFIKIFYDIGEKFNFYFVPVFEWVQILLCCLTFSYLIYFLAQIKILKWQRIVIFLFLLLNPFLHIFAPAPTKDVMFTWACILLFIEIYKLASDSTIYLAKKMNIKIILIAFFFVISRNNGWHSFLISAPFLIFVFRKHWLKMTTIILSVIILAQAVNYLQFDVFKVGKSRDGESYSPILQQMRKVYLVHEDDLSQEEIEALGAIFKLEDRRYSDTINDFSKRVDIFNGAIFKSNSSEYIKLWANLGYRFPLTYIAAFLNTNLPLWYLDSPVPRYSHDGGGYFHIEPINGNRSGFPFVNIAKTYSKINKNIEASNIPLVSNLTSFTVSIMAMLLVMLLLIYRKSKIWVVMLPLAVYWFTNLFGPVAFARYLMPYVILALPSVAILLDEFKKGGSN
ncbi:MAG: DUF6020 family protein [Oscillospiraceae bacterium]|nr:DUF6020 family protein [Oscillospiraceae bacterium]